jgi:hypothetical protein
MLPLFLLSSEYFIIIGLTSFAFYFLIIRFLSICSELERISASLRDLRDIAARDGELKRMLSSKHLTFIEEWRCGMKLAERGVALCRCCRKGYE